MANINYRNPDEKDYTADMRDSSANGANVDAGYEQQQHNTKSRITGKGTIDNSHRGSYLYPDDWGTNVNSFVANGIRGASGAGVSMYNQKVATDSGLTADPAVQNAGTQMGSSTYQYDDPYGFMSGVTDLNGKIGDALGGYANNSYSDYLKSPEYGNLADQYRQAGQLAMEDTLGTASQMSGGLDSSYAAAAAQQAYNGYMSNLQSAAQSAYQNQLANQQAQLSALQGERNGLANLYASDWTRGYTTDRDTQDDFYNWYFGLNNLSDSRLAAKNAQENTETGFDQSQQQINMAREQNEWERGYNDRAYADSREDAKLDRAINVGNTLESINLNRMRYGLPSLSLEEYYAKYGGR